MDMQDFMNSKAGQQALKQYQDEIYVKRKALIEERGRLRQERDTKLKVLQPELDKATADCKQARQVLEATEIRQRTATGKVQVARKSFDHQSSRIDKDLRLSAPPEVDQFIEEMQSEIQRLQTGGVAVSADGTRSNRDSLEQRIKALREATGKAEALKLVAVKDIAAELEHLRSELPEVKVEPTA